jgi:hypothetical protein
MTHRINKRKLVAWQQRQLDWWNDNGRGKPELAIKSVNLRKTVIPANAGIHADFPK